MEAPCPNCGASRAPAASDCPTCGIVFAKYRGPRMTAPRSNEPVTSAVPGLPVHEEPPQEAPEGVWRRGRTLIVSRMATLPDRCVSCNEPAQARLTRKLYWHTGWIYVFLLVNVLIYALIALVARKTAALEVPQCDRHLKIRRYGIVAAWAFMGLGCLAAWASAGPTAEANGLLAATPILIFLGASLVALVGGIAISRPVVARKIDDEFVWVGKCSRDFLASLPEAPRRI